VTAINTMASLTMASNVGRTGAFQLPLEEVLQYWDGKAMTSCPPPRVSDQESGQRNLGGSIKSETLKERSWLFRGIALGGVNPSRGREAKVDPLINMPQVADRYVARKEHPAET